MGSTSNRGRNKPTDKSGSVAPATFARLLAQANPNLPFAAWATHPYPTSPNLGPEREGGLPGGDDDAARPVRQGPREVVPPPRADLGDRVRGADEAASTPLGVSYAQQAADAKTALDMAAASPYVEMFVWFIIKDSTDKTWNSGLDREERHQEAVVQRVREGREGHRRPGAADRRPGKSPTIRLDVPFLTYGNSVGARVGITYAVHDGKKRSPSASRPARIAADQTVSFLAKFKPVKGKTYILNATVNDKHGQTTKRSVSLTVT